MSKRLFIGINLPTATKRQLSTITRKLVVQYPQIKWEDKDKLHITLKFLGSTAISPQQIGDALKIKLSDQVCFKSEFGELGVLVGRSTVVMIEIKKQEELLRTYYKVNNRLEQLGFAPDQGPFFPHITLGRSKSGQLVAIKKQLLGKLTSFEVTELTLFQSRLTSGGSIYQEVIKIALQPNPTIVL